ncbi:MAG: hypothetical protein CL850_02315 [Crocinitomicaceae bacterium]|nr:hypothetical protein [Crocinitomicaceae bacterium]
MMHYYTLITGASNGIGLEMADYCASKGMNILMISLPNENLEEKAINISEKYKINTSTFECDLTDVSEIDRLKEWGLDKGFEVNFLINNAGFGGTIPFEDMSGGLIDNMIGLNITAGTHLTNRFIPILKKNAPSNILNVSSLISNLVAPYKALYTATKTFVINLSVSLAHELKEDGIIVSTLLPGATPTNKVVMDQIEKGNFAARVSVMSPRKVAKIAINKSLKGKTIITTGTKNGVIRNLLKSLPNRMIAAIAINQFKKKTRLEKEQ